MKKIGIILLSCMFLSLGISNIAGATPHHETNDGHTTGHEKEWTGEDKQKVAELEKLGFDKHDIFHAIKLSKAANTEAVKILEFYKKNNTWAETAKHFGVDPSKIKHKHRWEKFNEYLEQNKERVVPYLAEYLNKEESEISGYLQNGTDMHTVVKASILSKLGNTEINEILAKKENGQSFRDIAKELKVEKTEMYKEMRKLKNALSE